MPRAKCVAQISAGKDPQPIAKKFPLKNLVFLIRSSCQPCRLYAIIMPGMACIVLRFADNSLQRLCVL